LKTLIPGSRGQAGSYLWPLIHKTGYEVVGPFRHLAADGGLVFKHDFLKVRKISTHQAMGSSS
jgi:GDP-D-mannose dehydratase